MRRLAWSQLRFRASRAVALLVGMLLATTAFTVLTAASRTAQLRTVGTVTAHFVPAYDILVRPQGARTTLETQTGSVQPNFLSGIYGGITMAQYRRVASIPGVSVAAPVAMVGYALLVSPISEAVPAASLARPGAQLYRETTTWISEGGTSRVTQPPSYLYVTPQRLGQQAGGVSQTERLADGRRITVCPSGVLQPGTDPFGVAAQSGCAAWSKANGYGPGSGSAGSGPGYRVDWVVPVLIAAVDPAAEAKLDGLSRAVISGRYLTENAHDTAGHGPVTTFPVLASSVSGTAEYAVTKLASLATPSAVPSMTVGWMTQHAAAPGRMISIVRTTGQQAYRALLKSMAARAGPRSAVDAYWTVGPTSYRRLGSGSLVARLVHNPAAAWYTGGVSDVSMDNAENQYRTVAVHAPAGISFTGDIAVPQLVGVFNPARVRAFDPLSAVPLGLYQPTVATPASAATRKVLGGADLLPNQNLGGYVGQPVSLITTLSALPALLNAGYYGQKVDAADPISVIRVRVAGVTGPNRVSLERIRTVAQQIAVRTHLAVDIVAGSSPAPTTVDLPAGRFGQPRLTVSEDWVHKGVAVAILTAIDKNSLMLFVLILVVCVLFVANSASAAVRARRRELGVLACLGWTRPRLFSAVLGELAAIGLAAGLLGAAVALPLTSVLGLHASPGRAMLAVPVSVAVAVLAGLVPAWLAARSEPVACVRPPVLGVRRARHPRGITALAVVNVIRAPGRAMVGAASLAIGVGALTVLAAFTFAFRGVVVGSLLGDAVAIQVRGVDYIAGAAAAALGVLAVADVLFLSIRERAPELAVIRALGWRESALARLVTTEGSVIGLTGSLAGAALGLAAAANFAGHLPAALYLVAGIAVAVGLLVTTLAALLPARALRRLATSDLLAED